MAKVIRVFGKADDFDIELSRKGDKWEVDIPPDMTDGVYAVQLTAIDELGDCAYWVGELYMVDGVCCLKIDEIPYRVRIKPRKKYTMKAEKGRHDIKFTSVSYSAEYEKKYNVKLSSAKRFDSDYIVEISSKLKTSKSEAHCVVNVDTKKSTVHPKNEIETEYTPKIEFFIRKGCSCYGD